MEGTIRTHDPQLREEMVRRVRQTATHIAEAAGATAEVIVEATAPVTWNDPAATGRILPSLQWAAGADKVTVGRPVMVAEDFAFFQEKIPGSYFLADRSPRACRHRNRLPQSLRLTPGACAPGWHCAGAGCCSGPEDAAYVARVA